METRFVDCRPREAYLEGHVPGAAHADPETDLTGDDGGGRHPLPRAEAFATWASAAGIGPETLVVGYDEGTGWAARLWWLLRHFGHDAAGVIPFDAWRGPLAQGAEQIAPRIFTPRARSDDTATAAEILDRLGDATLTLVDARAPERWRGETEPIDPVAGRIPGARNRFFLDESPLPDELRGGARPRRLLRLRRHSLRRAARAPSRRAGTTHGCIPARSASGMRSGRSNAAERFGELVRAMG